MTRARIVTEGQAMAMTPTMRASTPRTIKEVDAFLSMMGSFRSVSQTHGRPIRRGDPTPGSNTAIGTAFGWATAPGGIAPVNITRATVAFTLAESYDGLS